MCGSVVACCMVWALSATLYAWDPGPFFFFVPPDSFFLMFLLVLGGGSVWTPSNGSFASWLPAGLAVR